jgi:hypothetical protein
LLVFVMPDFDLEHAVLAAGGIRRAQAPVRKGWIPATYSRSFAGTRHPLPAV